MQISVVFSHLGWYNKKFISNTATVGPIIANTVQEKMEIPLGAVDIDDDNNSVKCGLEGIILG